MGCAVGGACKGNGLRDVHQQVAELQQQLGAAERERASLQQKIEALEKQCSKAPVVHSTSAASQAKVTSPRLLGPAAEDEAGGMPLSTTWAAPAAHVEVATPAGTGSVLQAAKAATTGLPAGDLTQEPHSKVPPKLDGVGMALAMFSEPTGRPDAGVGIGGGGEGLPETQGVPEDGLLPGCLPSLAEDEACISPRTPSVLMSETEKVVPAGSSQGAWLHSPGEAGEGKLTNSIDSSASTCTPGSQMIREPHKCHQCGCDGVELFQDSSDLNNYCERCWVEFYGQPPLRFELHALVPVELFELWQDGQLAQAWAGHLLPGWPPPHAVHLPLGSPTRPEAEIWSTVSMRVRRDIVGPHAREQTCREHLDPGDVLAGKYRVQSLVGQGHFTKAYLAEDLATGLLVCLKRHRSLSVEALSDLMVIGHRLEEVDQEGKFFPRLLDAFYDFVCFTIESLVEGQNCLSLGQSTPGFFASLPNLCTVAQGVLLGLSHLSRAGIVHNDVKPDNLIWVDPLPEEGQADLQPPRGALVRIVDFGCARLDHREEHGRNWSLAEGGAGHLGKWSPEMSLRLPIMHQGDVWGLAISLCELHCSRQMWRDETDTAEIILAQAIGLCNLRDGVPPSLLRRSPLDIRQLYTPVPRHFPLRRNAVNQLEALRPACWGLEQVLGGDWREAGKSELWGFLHEALVFDPAMRPSAAQLLECCRFVNGCTQEKDPLMTSLREDLGHQQP